MKVGDLIAKLDRYPNAWEVEVQGLKLVNHTVDIEKYKIVDVDYPYTGNKVYIILKSSD